MWSRSPLLLLRVRVEKPGRGFRIVLLLANHVLTGFLLAWEPLLHFLPGFRGEKLRRAARTALDVLWAVTGSEPQSFVNAEVEKEAGRIEVDLRTLGISGERGKPL